MRSVVSTSSNYSFTVTGNRNLVANFTPNSYNITATADPSVGGTIIGAGNYNYGASCTVRATPNDEEMDVLGATKVVEKLYLLPHPFRLRRIGRTDDN